MIKFKKTVCLFGQEEKLPDFKDAENTTLLTYLKTCLSGGGIRHLQIYKF